MERVRVIAEQGGPSLTKQAPAAETDVNFIVQRHIQQDIPFFESGNARYGDFSDIGDYHSAFERVRDAQAEFMRLPAEVRKACDNDVGVLLDKLANAETREDLIKLGLPVVGIPVSMEDSVKKAFGDMQRLKDAEDDQAAIDAARRGTVKGT